MSTHLTASSATIYPPPAKAGYCESRPSIPKSYDAQPYAVTQTNLKTSLGKEAVSRLRRRPALAVHICGLAFQRHKDRHQSKWSLSYGARLGLKAANNLRRRASQ